MSRSLAFSLLLTLTSLVLASATAARAADQPAAAAESDPLIEMIDNVIAGIDGELDGYIKEYLRDVGLDDSEFRDIERELWRTVRDERRSDPVTFGRIPEDLHLIQAKLRFLKPVHPAFAADHLPASLSERFSKLAELEAQLESEESAR